MNLLKRHIYAMQEEFKTPLDFFLAAGMGFSLVFYLIALIQKII